MEIRRASTMASVANPETLAPDATPRMAGSVPDIRSRRRRDNRPLVRAATLTRDQEYGFIRSDLRRLLLLSGVLVVAMIIVLFVVESLV